MIWEVIGWKRKNLEVVNGILDVKENDNNLETYVLPFCDKNYPRGSTFQQDNAPAQTVMFTRDFFIDESIVDMD